MRTAPCVPVYNTVEKAEGSSDRWPVSIEVIEPEDALVSVSPGSYRIPRRAPSPPPAPRVHRLSAKKAAVLADRVAKQELKKRRKIPPRNKRFCKLCHVSCNGSKTFYDHLNSKSHRLQVANKECPPRCVPCSRTFESHIHLERHKNSAGHLKVVTKQFY